MQLIDEMIIHFQAYLESFQKAGLLMPIEYHMQIGYHTLGLVPG